MRAAPYQNLVFPTAGSGGGKTSIPVNTSKRKHVLLLQKIIWPNEAPLKPKSKSNSSKALGRRLFL